MKHKQASGHTTCNLMRFKLNIGLIALKISIILARLVGGQLDYLEDTTLHTVVYKFQSEKWVNIPPCLRDFCVPGLAVKAALQEAKDVHRFRNLAV